MNKKKLLILIPVVLVVIIVLFIVGSKLLYSGPTSMFPDKWTDAVYAQSGTVNFSAKRNVSVTGNLNGSEISASYEIAVVDDRAAFTRVEGTGDDAALTKLETEIMPKALLTFTCSTDIADGISADAYPDAICMLQKYTFELWWGDENQGNATSELYTWGDDLALQTYAITTRPDGATVSALTFNWN